MAAKRRRRRGLILAGVLVLVALAGIAFVAARPARILGVGASSLSDSLVYEFDGDGGKCERVQGGRPDDTVWRCAIFVIPKGGSGQLSASYAVQANQWGCWDAERIVNTAGARLAPEDSACIIIFDYVHVLD